MSGSIGQTSPSPAPTPATTPAATGSSTGASGGTDALGSLANNFGSFLQLLMTQLKNQDPSSPLDTNQFTTELVQFTSVEQQINTNSSLKQLIQLTQAGEVIQSTGMLGHQVEVQSGSLSLQGGSATVRFSAPSAGQAEVVVTNQSGGQVFAGPVTAATGSNDWTWNGRDTAGNTVPDGAYRVSVTQAGGSGGTASALPFTVLGKVTGVQEQGTSVQLELGSLPVDFSSVKAVLK